MGNNTNLAELSWHFCADGRAIEPPGNRALRMWRTQCAWRLWLLRIGLEEAGGCGEQWFADEEINLDGVSGSVLSRTAAAASTSYFWNIRGFSE